MKYEIRNAAGKPCCTTDNVNDLCASCTGKVIAATVREPPNAYAKGIAALRAARGIVVHPLPHTALTAMSAFRQQFYAAADSSRAASKVPATSQTHLMPPNPYSEAALAKWRARR